MPEITKVFKVDITPEKFLDNCSAEELIEVQMLLLNNRYQDKIEKHNMFPEIKTRCCGMCDGVNDLCFTDMVCDIHKMQGCEICYGERNKLIQ